MTDTAFLPLVNKPGRYLGHEYNAVIKLRDTVELSCALVFPDLYEVGMSHQGLQILYHILNRQENLLAERCYCPDLDSEQLLRARKLPLTTLESARPLADFDLLGITLPYELCYTNILTVLDLAGIPFLACDRPATFPILLGGGSCSMNPEPVADFFDAILLGDGEEAILDIAAVLIRGKHEGSAKTVILEELARIDGVYIPSFFTPEYDDQGHILAITPRPGGKPQINRRVLADLDAIDHLKQPIVPNARIIHDRLSIEIARGCTRGCRFCQAGITYRPVRERSPEQIMELATAGIGNSGFEELALLSLSTGDYSCLERLLPSLMDTFADDYVSVAMPSMRVGTLSPAIMEQIRRVRKTGFTLAPEAGSERLRRVINKGITAEDLLATCRNAFALGWKIMKLYFMIGLPSETPGDIDEIVELVRRTKKEGDRQGRGRSQINVSIGTFVPKPHTPFQWERQIGIEESRSTINRLRQSMPKGCTLKWQDPRQSYLEGVFSRGDRRLAALIEAAWQQGARLDGWSDHYDLAIWQEAAGKIGLDLDDYLRRRQDREILPWQHLQSGVDLRFLEEERERAFQEIYTPDCRYHDCQGCGLCDFDTIQPVVRDRERFSREAGEEVPPAARRPALRDRPAHEETHVRYMVSYSRIGKICFLGHLEILRLIFRALRRAGITTNFSKGFNPTPKVSFGPALPVGTESLAEFFIMDLPRPLAEPAATARLLNDKLPPGLTVEEIAVHAGRIPADTVSTYAITFDRPLTAEEQGLAGLFSTAREFIVEKTRKGDRREVDIRPLIPSLEIAAAERVELQVVNLSGQPGIKPLEALQAILHVDAETALRARIVKTAWRVLENP
jgi:radical SAM family uncharacterized protein/radical SAM-linked protein